MNEHDHLNELADEPEPLLTFTVEEADVLNQILQQHTDDDLDGPMWEIIGKVNHWFKENPNL